MLLLLTCNCIKRLYNGIACNDQHLRIMEVEYGKITTDTSHGTLALQNCRFRTWYHWISQPMPWFVEPISCIHTGVVMFIPL